MPVLGWLLKRAGAIPLAPQAQDPVACAAAFDAADQVLAGGGLLCLFLEGGLSRDGRLQAFKPGVMKILARRPVPVVPVALQDRWGSYFSRSGGGAAAVPPLRRGWWCRVGLAVGPALAPDQVSPEGVRNRVQALLQAG